MTLKPIKLKIDFPFQETINFRAILLIFITLIFIGKTKAENADSLKIKHNFIYSGYFQYGKVLATSPYLKQTNTLEKGINEFAAVSFQVLKQTIGDKLWEQNYGFPSYGLGIYSASFLDNKELGTPIAIYGVFKAPFKRWDKFSFNYEIGFGVAFNWESFNPSENNYNTLIGAKESVLIDLGANLSYELSEHFDLGLGCNFTHFSNGALKIPNQGLNTFAPKISLAYNVNRIKPPVVKKTLPTYIRNTTIDFALFGGAKNVIYKGNDIDSITRYKGVYYPIFGLSTVINRQINYKSRLGVGITMDYDGSYNSTVFIENGELELVEGFHGSKLSLSIFPSYELVINKFSIVVQPGFYIIRKPSQFGKPTSYQRLGLHYDLGKSLFAGINLRAYNYHISDFIEWTIGYRLSLLDKVNH